MLPVLVIAGCIVALILLVIALILMRNRRDSSSLDQRLDSLEDRLAEFSERGEMVSLEEIELSQPFAERVLKPIGEKVGELLGLGKEEAEDAGTKNRPYDVSLSVPGRKVPLPELPETRRSFPPFLRRLLSDESDDADGDDEYLLEEFEEPYYLSISHPKLLSKRNETAFLLQIFLPQGAVKVGSNIREEFDDQEIAEHLRDSELKKGDVIKVKFFHPDIDFPEPAPKVLDKSVNRIVLLGKPKDTCEPGNHKVLVTISDAGTGHERESFTIMVNVVDFAFGKVSRPLLSKISAVVLGLGSFTMFVLALLEQIDKTVGLTSGTAAGVLMLAITTNFYNLYQRNRPATP